MLSKRSLDILLDLIEIKLSAIIVQDKEDIREVINLKKCKKELIEVQNRDINVSSLQPTEHMPNPTC